MSEHDVNATVRAGEVFSVQAAMPLSVPGYLEAYERTMRAYANAARNLDQVREILVDQDTGPDGSVWTVIDVPEHDSAARHPVYDAQIRALAAADGVPVDFRVINMRELRVPLDEALPRRRRTIFLAACLDRFQLPISTNTPSNSPSTQPR